MRVVGSRVQYAVSATPSGEALRKAADHQGSAMALAALPTTGMRRGIYRFASHAEANAHADEALARAIAENLLLRQRVR